jgi:AraC-like DNA-binding protein
MELGADDYLTKPSTAEELLGAIIARLEKQAAHRQWCAAQSQRISEPPPADTAKSAAPQSIFPACPKLRKVFDFIEANYHQPITLNDVAQAARYSPAYLTNLVRRQTGQTVHHWIVERRLAEACCLLLETDQTVNEIAEAVGYQNPGHFFYQFRQRHGTTPKAWRNSQQTQFSAKRN